MSKIRKSVKVGQVLEITPKGNLKSGTFVAIKAPEEFKCTGCVLKAGFNCVLYATQSGSNAIRAICYDDDTSVIFEPVTDNNKEKWVESIAHKIII